MSETPITLLLVDDTEANRYAERRILEPEGYKIVEAATGQDALRLVDEHRPDLVILDVKLPDISGFEVARRIRESPDLKWTQILHISATYRTAEYRAKGLESGADGYLTSPVEPVVLSATVRALLRARWAEERAVLLAKAQEALRARDDFVAMLSHDLRDPVGILAFRLGIIQKRLRGVEGAAASSELLADLEVMARQLERLKQMLNSLLETTRVTEGQVPLSLEPVDIVGLASELVEQSRERFQAAGCELTLHANGPIMGNWDRQRLDQIITNLLNNAMCYGPGRPVEVRVEAVGTRVRLSVRDQGIGIAPEDQHRIFQRYERATGSRQPGSFGIGLWIVQRLAGALGGHVHVRSEVGKGSTFMVDLPRAGGRSAMSVDASLGPESPAVPKFRESEP